MLAQALQQIPEFQSLTDSLLDSMFSVGMWVFPVAGIAMVYRILDRDRDMESVAGSLIGGLLWLIVAPFAGLKWLATYRHRRRLAIEKRNTVVEAIAELRGEFDGWLREKLLSVQIAGLDGKASSKSHADTLESALLANAKATVALETVTHRAASEFDRKGEEAAIRREWESLKSLGV